MCLGLPTPAQWDELRETSFIKTPHTQPLHKYSYFSCVQNLPATYQTRIFNSCICNELHALLRRHLTVRPTQFDPGYFRRKSRPILQLYREIQVERARYSAIINGYVGGKKKIYERAAENLRHTRNYHAWAAVSMFVKAERFTEEEITKKVPRAIQFRRPEFNLLLASYLKPYEHAVYSIDGMLGLREVAKGLNNIQRASILQQATALFDNPIFISTDHSKFDSYVNKTHLGLLHDLYLRAYSQCTLLRRLLNHQKVNWGYSRNGLRYRVEATRMSGDYDTG